VAKKQDNFYNEIFHALETPLVLLDENSIILDMNPAVEKLFTVNFKEVKGKTFCESFPLSQGDLPDFQKIVSKIKTDETLKKPSE